MNTNGRSRAYQHRFKAVKNSSDAHSFFNLLTSNVTLGQVEELLPEHRERLYPPTETLSMFLAQAMNADRSCQNVVNQAAVSRLACGLSTNSIKTGGYCRARQRLPIDMISQLTCYLGEHVSEQAPESWSWRGRPVRLVDGTTITMPDTPANQQKYPQSNSQKPGLGFPICRLLGIFCLASGMVLNAAICPFKGKGADERTLLRAVQDSLKTGDVVLGDALFATYFFIADMQSKGIDILMQQQGSRSRRTDFRLGQKLGPKDHLVVLEKPKNKPDWMSVKEYAAATESITVREFGVSGKVFVTTLNCPKATSKAELKRLYAKRWHVELDLRDIKSTLGMGILSCKSPAMIEKEIWVYLLAYNLIRLVMAQSAILGDIIPREISFKHCLQIWLSFMSNAAVMTDEMIENMCGVIAQQQVGNRSGRIEPRVLKRRPKPYPIMTQKREEMRAQVREYGHPKKLK